VGNYFISDYFSRAGSDSVYKLTIAYTEALFSSFSSMDGVIYDSVDHVKGTWVAIRPHVVDAFTETKNVQIVSITNHLGYGIFDFEEVSKSSSVMGNDITWS
jgi:hypothetical protein